MCGLHHLKKRKVQNHYPFCVFMTMNDMVWEFAGTGQGMICNLQCAVHHLKLKNNASVVWRRDAHHADSAVCQEARIAT